MINLIMGWFELIQYNNKQEITIAALDETTWLTRYSLPIEIMYDQGSEFIGHEFRKYLIGWDKRDIILDKHIGESNFQWNIGTDSWGYS